MHEDSPSPSQPRGDDSDQPAGPPDWPAILLDGIDVVLFTLDRGWRFTYLNRHACAMLGRTRESLIGRVVWEVFPTLSGSPFETCYRQAMDMGRAQHVEAWSPTSQAWFDVHTYPVEPGLAVAFKECSPRKQAEEALREQTERAHAQAVLSANLAASNARLLEDKQRELEERTRLQYELERSQKHLAGIIDLSADAVISIDEGQRICLFNPAAESIFGYAAAEVIGLPVDILIPERARSAHGHHVRSFSAARAQMHAGATRGYLYGLRRNGDEFPLEASISKVVVDGHTIATVCLRDISETLRVQEQLRLLESAVHYTTEAVIITNADLDVPGPQIVFVNPAFCAMTGHAADEVIGQTPRMFQGAETDRAVLEQLREELTAGRPFHGEIINYRKGGAQYYVKWTTAPIRNAAGRISHFVALQRDISARKRAERQVQASEARIRRGMHRLQNLYSIGQAILSATSLEMIARRVVRHTAALLPSHCVSVLAFDLAAGRARTLALSCTGEIQTPPAESPLRPDDIADGFADGQLVAGADGDAVGMAHRCLPAAPPPTNPFLSVPLLSQGRLIGALNLKSETDKAFSSETIEIAQEIANQLAVAMQQSQLFQEVQDGRDRLAVLSRRLLDVQEEERRHLARELHDEIGQALTLIRLMLQNLEVELTGTTAPRVVGEISGIVQNLLEQIRTLSLNLRPSILDDLGLISTLRWYLDQQSQRSGLSIHFSADDQGKPIDPQVATACFRIVQESLTNSLRHAGANSVTVSVGWHPAAIEVLVADDGCGFDQGNPAPAGMGLIGMQERAALLGGACAISSTPGQGTLVRAVLPLQRQEDPEQISGISR